MKALPFIIYATFIAIIFYLGYDSFESVKSSLLLTPVNYEKSIETNF